MRVSFLFLPPPFHGLFPGGSALDSKLIGLSSTVDGHCVVCSGKTRASHCVSGMNIGELSWKHDKMLGRIGEGVGGWVRVRCTNIPSWGSRSTCTPNHFNQ